MRVDQRQAPSGVTVNGTVFQSLGAFQVNSGTLRVVLGNDADNYVIADAVRVNPVPSLATVVDNDDAGFATAGYWNTVAGNGGDNNDFRYAPAGDGSLTATWQQTGLAPGTYDVEVTWTNNGQRASNAPYQVYDGSTLLATVLVNQQQAPSGVTVNGTVFQSLGVFQIASGTLRVVLDNDANSYIIADAMRIVPAPPPTQVVDNDDAGFATAGFWNTVAGAGGDNNDFRYAPAGDGSLTATWQQTGLAPGTYDVEVTWTNNGQRASNAPYRIYDGNTLLATVRVDQRQTPSGVAVGGSIFQSLGTFQVSSGALRVVLGNDADNYVIADAVQIVPVPPQVAIVDNNDANFTTAGFWNTVAGAGGYNNDFRYAPAGDGSSTATWQQTGLAPGTYDVEVTWTNNGQRASNAPYRIYDGTTLLATVRVDQRQVPAGVAVGGSIFQSLGVFQVSSGTLRVVLGNDADSYVIADAIRIVASGS